MCRHLALAKEQETLPSAQFNATSLRLPGFAIEFIATHDTVSCIYTLLHSSLLR